MFSKQMKRTYLMFLLTTSLSLHAQMSVFDANKPVGFATVGGGTTGGEGGGCITVTSADELKKAMKGSNPAIIYIKGEINTDAQISINNAANKTVIGLPGAALTNLKHSDSKDETGILALKSCKNIILRNITFKASGAYDIDGRDNLWLSGTTNCWIDHCDFQDGVDGNLDISNASDNISVTWCRFRYLKAPYKGGSGGSDDHRFSSLIGSSDKNVADTDKLNVTFQFCWWDEGCRERMPRVRFGKIHIINCLYNSSVANYCIGAGHKSSVFVESTSFVNINSKKGPFAPAGEMEECDFENCSFRNTSGNTTGTGAAFMPSAFYELKPIDVLAAENAIKDAQCGAGATLKVSEGKGVITKEGSHNTYLKEIVLDGNKIPVSRGKFGYQVKVPFDYKTSNLSAEVLDTRAKISDYVVPSHIPGIASFKVTAFNGDVAYYAVDITHPSYATIQKTWQTSTFNANIFVAATMDKDNWTVPEGKKYFENTKEINGELCINGVPFEETRGLHISAPANKIRLDKQKNAIVLASNRCAVTIPLCDKGDIISIKHITASVGKACGFTASNTLEGSSTETTSNAMSTFTVSSDGDVTLKPTGSTIIYSISIFHP